MVAGEGIKPPTRAPDAKTFIDCCMYLKNGTAQIRTEIGRL